MQRKIFILLFLFLILTYFADITFAQQSSKGHPAKTNSHNITRAVAVISPTKNNGVHGIVVFTKIENGIKITANLKGLSPGVHGFHIHEYGDCSSDDAASAGGHFNPDKVKHGGPLDYVRHAGDLGNITADDNGNAHIELVDNQLSFSGLHNIIGHAVVVHAEADDLKSQPSGNAGDRVGCGVIGIARSE